MQQLVFFGSILGVAALFGGTFLALRPLLLRLVRDAAQRRIAEPIPKRWLDLVESRVPAVRSRDNRQQDKLLRSMRSLMQNVHWEGCGGLELTEEVQVTIAAQACLLTLEFAGDPYPRVREILVYPRAFFPTQARDLTTLIRESDTRAAAGQALSTGSVVVAWDQAVEGGADPHDGDNVVFHEFAHQIAFQSQLIPDSPAKGEGASGIKYLIPNVRDPVRWNETLKDSMDQLCDQLNAGGPSVIDEYGATNLHEFFAVATETFFERPTELRSAYPDLYEQLQSFYRQDPATRWRVPTG